MTSYAARPASLLSTPGANVAPAGGPAAGRIVATAFAAATTVRQTLGVGKLVAKTALEPAAQAGELGRIQAQVLLLGHLDGDGLERLQERRAAERTAAGTVPAVHLGLVANTDLPHLDPRPELRRELAHELAEVDPAVGGEIEEQLRSVERLLDACQLHPQSVLADLQERD